MSDIFFLNIFDEILKINDKEIMIVFDIDGEPWFKSKDLLKCLDYNNLDKTLNKLNINKQYICKFENLKVLPSRAVPLNFQKNTVFINESGLYELLIKSTKPFAKIFLNKYLIEIMPQIRKYGKYELNKKEMKKIDKINKKLKSIKKSNKDLLINQKNIDYPEGNHIYIIKQKVDNKTYHKIGYTKNLNRRIKTYNTGNVNKIYFNYIIKVDDKEIDNCIKKIMKNKEYIKNKEFYRITLNNALKFITRCSLDLEDISCGYCLKSYKFKNIKLHKC